MGRIRWAFLLISFPLLVRADIGLLLHESTGRGVSELTSAGHAAVYLSNVCTDTPIKLRLCRSGEPGSVIANYTSFGENERYEWNIAPVTVYLYGVEEEKNIPIYGNDALLELLQEQYRQKYLPSVCPASRCGIATSDAHWRDMAGSTFARDIYCFRVSTTRAQDEALIQQFNSIPNVNRYNGFTRNCADFARGLINTYFPGAAQPDHLNDFGMTSPKAIAKSFARYGHKHPELRFSVEKFPQLPGPIKRSADCRKGTEVGFRSKKWFVPMILLRPHELGAFVALYALTGRFNPEHEYERYANPSVADLVRRETELRKTGRTAELIRVEEARRAEQEAAIGSRKLWNSYRQQFQPILAKAFEAGVFRNRSELRGYFKELAQKSKPALDAHGSPALRIGELTVGLTREGILAPGSDRRVAYRLMLAKVNATLKSPSKNRETLPRFKSDWDILMRLNEAKPVVSADDAAVTLVSPHVQ